jgi:flagellar protein FlaJ
MNLDSLKKLKEVIVQEKKIVKEITNLFQSLEKIRHVEERRMVVSQIRSLRDSLKVTNKNIPDILKGTYVAQQLVKPFAKLTKPKTQMKKEIKKVAQTKYVVKKPEKKKPLDHIRLIDPKIPKDLVSSELEKETLKRLRRIEKKITKDIDKEEKPSGYTRLSNQVFFHFSRKFVKNELFRTLKADLVKANLHFILPSYISIIFFTTLLAAIFGFFAFIFFLFFDLGLEYPVITRATTGLLDRFLKVSWILVATPLIAFITTYFYPSLEKKASEGKINQELPFATIHMSSISSSMIEPSKIFDIIIQTKEYPHIEKEFTKLINEINVHGYNLVNALRNRALYCPSSRLSELFNGLATTITSGGDLPDFFEKRAQSLLFEHKLEREKEIRASETFMDIYISVVIAAPMMLMLLLMMMKIGGLGISLSTGMISLLMVLGVLLINILFLTFLHLKQPS